MLLVTRIAAHYRQGVYEELLGQDEQRWTVAADPNTIPEARSSVEGGIAVIPPAAFEVDRFIPLRNRWLRGAVWQSGVVRAIRRVRPDCVVFEGSASILSTWVAAVLCRSTRVRVAFWTTGWHRPDSGARRWVRLVFYHLAERLLLYGRTGAEIGARMGYPADRMTVIRNSVTTRGVGSGSEAEALDEIARLPDSAQPLVGAVIRLNPAKDLRLILTATEKARRLSGLDLGVLLVGEGPAEASLRELAESLDVPLFLTGAMYSQAALNRVYELLRVTIIPQWAGLTTVQSMSFGCPVVTHGDFTAQSAEAEAIVPGVTGSFFSPGDSHSAAREILRWVTMDDDERRATADACRAEVSKGWLPAAHARAIVDAVDDLMASGN